MINTIKEVYNYSTVDYNIREANGDYATFNTHTMFMLLISVG